MEPILPNVARIEHPHNRYMAQIFVLYARTLAEFCEQIGMLKRLIERHELN
jgi:hypothetical protein